MRKHLEEYNKHVDWLPTNLKGLKSIPTFKKTSWNGLDQILELPFKWVIGSLSGNGQFTINNGKKIIEILKNKPETKVIVEIGTTSRYEGSSTQTFITNKNPDTKFYSIDIAAGDPGVDHAKYKNITFIQSKSVDQKVKGVLGEQLIDILFIDGDHSLQTVFEEYAFYLPIMKKDGVIILHDTTMHPGPFLFMEAVDENIFKKEILFEEDYGIGVIYLDSGVGTVS